VRHITAAIVMIALATTAALGASEPSVKVSLILKDHKFDPSTITVPVGQRITVELFNRDGTADDFDSDDLHIDKDVGPHGRVSFVIGPLRPGRYAFKGELHAATATGEIVAVAAPAP
jgi:plastocyanin